jgi:hypothetical protein
VEGSFGHDDEPLGSIRCWVAAQLAASQEGLSSISKEVGKKYLTLNEKHTLQ